MSFLKCPSDGTRSETCREYALYILRMTTAAVMAARSIVCIFPIHHWELNHGFLVCDDSSLLLQATNVLFLALAVFLALGVSTQMVALIALVEVGGFFLHRHEQMQHVHYYVFVYLAVVLTMLTIFGGGRFTVERLNWRDELERIG